MNPVDNGALSCRSPGHHNCTRHQLRRVHPLSGNRAGDGIAFFKSVFEAELTSPKTPFRRIDRPASGRQKKASHRPAWRPAPGPGRTESRQECRRATHRGRRSFSGQHLLLHSELPRTKSHGVAPQHRHDHDGHLPDTSKRKRTHSHLCPRSRPYRSQHMVDRLPSADQLQAAPSRPLSSKPTMPGVPGRPTGSDLPGESRLQPQCTGILFVALDAKQCSKWVSP